MTVSVIIIAYNEQNALPTLLGDIKAQTFPHGSTELLLVDSNSTDNTKQILQNFADENSDYYAVKVLDNPRKIQAAGWNVGLENATCDVIIRLDAHTRLPNDFISKNIQTLEQGHDICGGKVNNYNAENTRWGEVITATESSMFGGSFAKFRRSEKAGYVDTLGLGAYRKEVYDKAGKFNENLARTEDNELHYRMRKAGYKFYYNPEIETQRETRNSFKKLTKQKYGNGYWIGLTLGVCPGCISLYHLVPFGFLMGIVATTVLAVFGLWYFAAAMWGLYVLFTIVNTIISAVGNKFSFYYFLMPFMFLILHLSYGTGTLIGLIKMPFKRKKLKRAE